MKRPEYARPISRRAAALAAALALALCACAPGQTSAPGSSPAAGAESPAAADPAAGELQLLSPGNEQGRYAIGYAGSGPQPYSLLCWVDYAAAAAAVLCSQPNCTHDSDACTAWLQDGSTAQVWAQGDGLLFTDLEDGNFVLYRADADGSNRFPLLTSPDPIQTLLCDGAALYYLAGTGQPTLCRLPLSGGEAQAAAVLPQGTQLLGAAGRCAVLLQSDGSAAEQAFQAGEYASYSDAFAAVGMQFRVWLQDVDTGACTELAAWTDTGDGGYACLWQGDTLYRLSGTAPAVLLCTGRTGAARTVTPALPADAAALTPTSLQEGMDGRLFVTLSGESESRRFAVDPATGDAQELPLTLVTNGRSIPVPVLGQGGGRLLVEYAIQPDGTDWDTRSDGTISETERYISRYALIPAEDFLSGQPAYQDIALAENLLLVLQ